MYLKGAAVNLDHVERTNRIFRGLLIILPEQWLKKTSRDASAKVAAQTCTTKLAPCQNSTRAMGKRFKNWEVKTGDNIQKLQPGKHTDQE